MSSIRTIEATGLEALQLTTRLLQRARIADPVGGIWEAADHQWWWREPRLSDETPKTFWLDDDGPVAATLITSWSPESWQVDPVAVTGTDATVTADLWAKTIHLADSLPADEISLPIRVDDQALINLALGAGFEAGEIDTTKWMPDSSRPDVIQPRSGFTIRNRVENARRPHHMIARNGDGIAESLAQCSLYDPELDLTMETSDGEVAGYTLYWFDPVTRVGLVEPVRTEESFQRLGIARTLLTHGLELLAARGATRIKVSCESEAAAKLYDGVGFRDESTTTWYTRSKPA